MKSLIAIGIVCCIGLLALGQNFEHGPYCGAPDEDGVTVCWLYDVLFDSARVEYCVEDVYKSEGTFTDVQVIDIDPLEKPSTISFRLEGLEAGTRYSYRVVTTIDGVDRASSVGTFTTEPGSGATTRFGVLSDTQLQHEGTNRLELVGDAMGADEFAFDFILHAGDIVEGPSTYYWDHWFDSFDDMLLRAVFLPVLGNHEKNNRSYYEYFTFPPGEGKRDERWWAMHYGDLVVVGLDTNVKGADEIMEQQEWCREHLSGEELHKFVIFHHPVFTSDSEYGTGYFYDTIYHPIFVENGVDIVFNGHSHHYERINRDNVIYMVVGGGGATPRRTRPDHIQGSDVSIENRFFYVRVTTEPTGIDVDTVSVAREANPEPIPTPGELLDSFYLPLEGAVAVIEHELAGGAEDPTEPVVSEVVASAADETQAPEEAAANESVGTEPVEDQSESADASEQFPPWGVALIVVGVGVVAIVLNLLRTRKRS